MIHQGEIKRLYRSRSERKIVGVCGGLGEYFHCDPVIFRIIFVVLFFMGGFGLLTYLVMWFVVPEIKEGREQNTQ